MPDSGGALAPTGPWATLLAWLRAFVGLDEEPVRALPVRAGDPGLPELEPTRAPAAAARPPEHVRLCIDFGTSQSAVARAVPGADPELAVLQADGHGQVTHTIDSDVAFAAGEPAVLGAVARVLEERRAPLEFHRSLKRVLSDVRRLADSHLLLRLRVEALIEELLRLALAPDTSGTVAAQARLQGREIAEIAAPLGLPGKDRLREVVGRGVLDLYLCVPNAFGNFEEEVLRAAAQAAGEAVAIGLGAETPHVVAHLVREADAVAWWELHRTALTARGAAPARGTWLVFDVGAGSTDAALVDVRVDDGQPAVRVLAHTGVAFGGTDVDELFLRVVAEKAGLSVPHGLDQRVRERAGTRALQVRQFADAKIDWAREHGAAAARAGEPGLDRWLAWSTAPDGPAPDPEVWPPFRPPADDWPVREVGVSGWAPAYARFLRAAVSGVVRALRRAAPDAAIERVIVSGRGTLLPGIQPLLLRELRAAGWPVATLKPVGADDPVAMKLACVLGIAVAASHAAVPDRLPQRLSDEIAMRDRTLVPRGLPLADDEVRAAITLPAADGHRRLVFHQHRCPREVAEAVAEASLWEQRHLGAADVHLFEPLELHAAFDTRTGQLQLWRRAADGSTVPIVLEQDPVVGAGRNPITGLPFGWAES